MSSCNHCDGDLEHAMPIQITGIHNCQEIRAFALRSRKKRTSIRAKYAVLAIAGGIHPLHESMFASSRREIPSYMQSTKLTRNSLAGNVSDFDTARILVARLATLILIPRTFIL